MIAVAIAEGIKIYCMNNDRFAFFNSPYPAHRLMTGIDIYSDVNFGGLALSPVSGEVVLIRKIKAPIGRFFKDAGYDYVILLQNKQSKELVVKILHVDPCVSLGEHIHIGEPLGVLLRSGYFGFTTAPHVHVEVRPSNDPLRVRGGFIFKNLLNIDKSKPVERLKGIVKKIREDVFTVNLDNVLGFGLPADIGGIIGILDGGIPIYGWFGAHASGTPQGDIIKIMGVPVGKITKIHRNTFIAECLKFNFMINKIKVNLFLTMSSFRKQSIKIAPVKRGLLNLENGEEVEVKINND